MKIYAEHEKPKVSKKRRHQLRKFYNHNINPVTGFPNSAPRIPAVLQVTAKVIDSKQPAFRLAI